MMLRRLLAAMIALTLISGPVMATPPLAKPKLIAVYFYADWCPNCKILSPQFAKARVDGGLDDKAVLFVTMNLTNQQTIHQSILLASALGIDGFVKAQGSGTGYVALLDARSKKELARFDRDSASDAIAQGIGSRL